MEAKLITTDGRVIPIVPQDKESFELEEMYNIIKCDVVQVIPIAGTRKILIIDEEGKLKDKPIVNVLATNLAHEHKAISSGNSIVGNAILCDDTMID